MEQNKIIFKNSKNIINEGKNIGEGILYCGKKYTNKDACECGNCDGYCGPENGCACPDCEYTLTYILYSTNKMICEKCKKNLIRIKLCNLLLLLPNNPNKITCKKCKKNIVYPCIQISHCFKCNYSICSKCAFLNISSFQNKNKNYNIYNYNKANFVNLGAIYCGKKYTNEGYCLCNNCDGNCGPDNGCPCSMCSAFLGYNIYLYNNDNNNNLLKCVNDGNLLIKSNSIEYSYIKLKNEQNKNINESRIKPFFCNKCNSIKKNDSYINVYYCSKCFYCVCQHCVYFEVRNDINFICPDEPIFLTWKNLISNKPTISYKNIEKLILNEYLNNINNNNDIKNEISLFISKKREKPENTKNVNLYLKTLNGKIFNVNINNGETVNYLKNEIKKLDNNINPNKIKLLFKKQILKNWDFLCDYELEDNSIILIIKI